ncbi:hypothetical protein [Burkholderia gladioli]|uniref:hypothetical protein n=1 Tax=Burkholderia gladioli TaxID=28095 RepID=UPI00264E69F9|nr:hypothetical protein [Burkholderia gladioli]MDN7500191.1 hypothetical protein [Burkholderia gladioli]
MATYGTAGIDVRVMRGSLNLRVTLAITARCARHQCSAPAADQAWRPAVGRPCGAEAGRTAGAAVSSTLTAFRDARRPDVVCSERGLVALHVEAYPPVSMVETFRRATGKAAGRR